MASAAIIFIIGGIVLIYLLNWMIIKKLSHDVKSKLSIVFLIAGILMMILGGIGFNSTATRNYRLENNTNDTIKNNVNSYLDNNNKELREKHEMYSAMIAVGLIITIEGAIIFIGSGNKQKLIYMISENKNKVIKPNKNEIECGYKEKLSELNKIYNLYENKIYNQQEYISKKEEWIKSLEIFDFNIIEIDFLNEMIEFVNKGIIENGELDAIKHIVYGKYNHK